MKAFVTGANGFIGSQLIRRLTAMAVPVRAIVRQGFLTERDSRGLVERVRGDVTEADVMNSAAEGCDIGYHCAWGGNTLEEQRLVNVTGTRNVISAAARAGLRRVVHLSSMAVHGRNLPNVLTEDCPLATRGDPYTVSKAEGEAAAFEVGAAAGVEVVALRPTLVYGPGAKIWLIDYFERVRSEQVSLINGGKGLANLVHVEDVVDGMLSAAERQGVAGHAFLLNGECPITWSEYLGYFAKMCGKPEPPARPAYRVLLEVPFAKVYSILTNRTPRVQNMDIQQMTPCCAVSIDKAKRMLAYRPRVSIAEGMAECESWLRREGYLPPVPGRPEAPTHLGVEQRQASLSAN